MKEGEDLYAGLTLPTRTAPKRKLHDDKANDQEREETLRIAKEAAETAAAEKKQKTAKEIDVADAISRLKTHMVVDKKFAKAAKLFGQLVRERMSAENQAMFVSALKEMIAVKGARWSGKPEFKELIKSVLDKRDAFPSDDVEIHNLLDDWKLLALTHAELFTDDTFEFARAAKQVRVRLECVTDSTESKVAQLALLMPLLRTLFRRHSVPWAKTAVETVLGQCTRKRLLFAASERDEVDQWTTTMRERKAAPAMARSAASDARRNIVVVEGGSRSEASATVGRANHPLFNRNAQ